MAQHIADTLSNADTAPQGIDGGLNLKGDPTRLAPPATTRSDNAHYDVVGSVSQLPGFVSVGAATAKHIYNLHARDIGAPSQSGDTLLHGEFPDGPNGYTTSAWSYAGTSTLFPDQPSLPFTLRSRNLAGKLNVCTDANSSVNAGTQQLSFARQETLPVDGKRRYAIAYASANTFTNEVFLMYSVGYVDGMTELVSAKQVLTGGNTYYDISGVQNTNQWVCVRVSGSSTLEILRFDFNTGFISSTPVTGVTTSILSSSPFQLFHHQGRTFLAYYTNAATPILMFLDLQSSVAYTTPIGGTLTPGFCVFSPITHQNRPNNSFCFVVKNNSFYALYRNSLTSNFTVVGGPTALPNSTSPQTGVDIFCSGAAIIADSSDGTGPNISFLCTIFRHLPENLVIASGSATTTPMCNVAVDQFRFVVGSSPASSGFTTLVNTSVCRFPAGAIIASKAFNLCPSEAQFAGPVDSKQSFCLFRSNAYEYAAAYASNLPTYGQPTYFLLDHRARIVSRFLESSAPFSEIDKRPSPYVATVPSLLFSVPTDQVSDQAALTVTLPAWSLVNASFSPPVTINNAVYSVFPPVDTVFCPAAYTLSLPAGNASVPAIQAGPYTVFSGALTVCHDGFQTAEANYHFATPNLSVTPLTSGAVLGGIGAYYYVAVQEFYDAQGQLVRSQPSTPFPVYVAGTFYGAIVTIALIPSSKQSVYPNKVRIKLYRSIKNVYADGNYYYCGQSSVGAVSSTTLTPDNPGFAAIRDDSFVDNAVLTPSSPPPPPNAINSQPRIYTAISANGVNKVYQSSPPPSFFWQTASKGRFWGLSQFLGQYRVYYTAPTANALAPEWNFNNYVALPPDIGDARSIESLDRAIITFGTRYNAVLTGEGPPPSSPTGVPSPGDNIDALYAIPSPAGVIGSGAPSRIPDGLVFQGLSGIQLLDRGLSVSAIGAPVDVLTGRQTGNLGIIYGRGVTLPSLQSVVWPNAKGAALVYSYLTKKFSTWPLLSGACSLVQRMDGTIVAALQPIVGSQYQGAASAGSQGSDLGILNASAYSPIFIPSATAPGLVLETPWILPAAASGGECRVWNACLTGTWLGPHTLQVEQAYNYEPYTLTRTIDMSVAPRQYQAIFQPLANTRMVAVRYRISLIPAPNLTTAYPMATLSDLVLFSAKQQGTVRSSANLRG